LRCSSGCSTYGVPQLTTSDSCCGCGERTTGEEDASSAKGKRPGGRVRLKLAFRRLWLSIPGTSQPGSSQRPVYAQVEPNLRTETHALHMLFISLLPLLSAVCGTAGFGTCPWSSLRAGGGRARLSMSNLCKSRSSSFSSLSNAASRFSTSSAGSFSSAALP